MKLMTKFAGAAGVVAILGSIFFFSAGSQADNDSHESTTASEVTAAGVKNDDAGVAKIREELAKMIPQASTAEIVSTDADSVYRIELQGNYAYVYTHGDFVLLGDLYNTEERVNVGEQARSAQMAALIADVPINKMIVFGPQDAKRHITVFTDIDCGYCRKLHLEIPELNEAGIQVRYLAFPRAGVGSQSHKKYVSVWCSDDQQESLTAAKSGNSVPSAECSNPVEETYKLGQQVGVRGTPTIIFDDGTVTPGYIPSDELIRRLGI